MLLSKPKELNGVFTFKEAFTTYLFPLIGSTIRRFQYVNVIDPGAQDTIKITIKYG
jgi:hypothetical protein